MKATHSLDVIIVFCVLLIQAETEKSESKLVKRGVFTRESCASACVSETAIKCRFVNFNSMTGKCVLSTSLGVGMQVPRNYNSKDSESKEVNDRNSGRGGNDGNDRNSGGGASGGNGRDDISHKVTNLESRLNEIKENVEELDEIRQKVGEMRLEAEKASKSKSEIIDELQNSKMHQEMAVASLNRKVGSLAVGMQRTLSDTKAFQHLQYRFEKELAEMKHSMRALALQVQNVLEQTSQLPSDLSSIKQKSDTLTKQMSNIKDKDSSLMQDLMALKNEMTTTHQSLEPQLKEIKMSQATIIEDMSHLGNSEENNRKKLSELQARLDHNGEDTKDALSTVNTLRSATRAMQQMIKETRSDITKLSESYQSLQVSNSDVQQKIDMVKSKQNEEHVRLTNAVNKIQKTAKTMESLSLSQTDIKTQIEEMAMKLNDLQAELSTLKSSQEPFTKIKDIQRNQDAIQLKLKRVIKDQGETRERLVKMKTTESEMDDASRRDLKQLSARLDDVDDALEKLRTSLLNMEGKISRNHHLVTQDKQDGKPEKPGYVGISAGISKKKGQKSNCTGTTGSKRPTSLEKFACIFNVAINIKAHPSG